MSVRDLTAGMVTELTARVLRPVLFFELAYDGGTLRLWTGLGDTTWDSQTWTGAGNLLKVEPAAETLRVEAQGFTATLGGVNPAYVALALDSLQQGRRVRCWLGCLDASDAIVADPSQFFEGRMDVPTLHLGAVTATISVTAENRWIDLTRPRIRRYTSQDQQADFPGDLGFDYVTSLANRPINWGAGASQILDLPPRFSGNSNFPSER